MFHVSMHYLASTPIKACKIVDLFTHTHDHEDLNITYMSKSSFIIYYHKFCITWICSIGLCLLANRVQLIIVECL